MLRLERVSAFYGSFQVLWDIDLELRQGDCVCVLGPNGAGKSTLLKAIAGLVGVRGRILLEGRDIAALPAPRRVALGISLVMERRRLFAEMDVRENLHIGGCRLARKELGSRLDEVIALLPGLEQLLVRRAGDLSGGQQQLGAIGRGLMARPRLLMLDEPFLGLSPSAVLDVSGIIERLRASGLTILFNEQNVQRSLALSNQACVLASGRLVATGASESIGAGQLIERVYFGTDSGNEVAQ